MSDDTTMPTASEVARLERRMEQRWRELCLSEQMSTPSLAHLEWLYDRYLNAMDAYMSAVATRNRRRAPSAERAEVSA